MKNILALWESLGRRNHAAYSSDLDAKKHSRQFMFCARISRLDRAHDDAHAALLDFESRHNDKAG